MKKCWQIKAAADRKAEILIYDRIGETWWGEGIAAKGFAEDLAALGDLDEITVRINSEGGNVFEGNSIYNTLLNHPAKVVVRIDSAALSIASVIAMAGDEIKMAENALMMIHDPWGGTTGNSREMREMADLLDKIKTTLIVAYGHHTDKTDEEISELMAAETWLNATEALELGLVDEITGRQQVENSVDLSRFQNCPMEKIEACGWKKKEERLPPKENDIEPEQEEVVAEFAPISLLRKKLDLAEV